MKTIEINDDLERQIRACAVLDDRTVNEWVENHLLTCVASALEVHHSDVLKQPNLGRV